VEYVGESMTKKKSRQKEVIWKVLNQNGCMTATQICDIINDPNNKYGVSLMPRRLSSLMRSSLLFEKWGKDKVTYSMGQTQNVIVWRARTIDEVTELCKTRGAWSVNKLPRLIRSEVESRLEELV
jgi:hypothetical protein